MLLKLIVGILSMSFAAIGLADNFPPLGKRLYNLGESTDRMRPVKIQLERQSSERMKRYLRDPILPETKRQSNDQGIVGVADAPQIGKHRYQEAKFSFAKLAVKGRYSKPRVNFDQKRLRVGKATETPRLDFLDRLEQSAQRSRLMLRDQPKP